MVQLGARRWCEVVGSDLAALELAALTVGGAILTDVKAIRAHVQNGKIVPDEPIELPEGAAVEVLLPENLDMTAQERAELEAEIEASTAEFEHGEFEDAHAFALRLVAKS
jgi:hypothetical protein